jgi:transcriptional regulator with XRE-family HTH domain
MDLDRHEMGRPKVCSIDQHRKESGWPVDMQAACIKVGTRKSARRATDLDRRIGRRQIGLTFQQVQKYEKGTHRISASRLQEIASFLKVPVATFYDPDDQAALPPIPLNTALEAKMLRLIAAFRPLKPDCQALLLDLCETLAEIPPRSA